MPSWIPLAAAALLVLAIYLIRPAAQTFPVASTLLWRRLMAARKRRRDRLRWLLSLLLAMTVAGLLSVAASRAPWLQPGGGDPTALVFDPSPTMLARLPDGGPRRIDLAAAEARRIVLEADADSRFTLNGHPYPLTATEARAALARPLRLLDHDDTEPAIPSASRVWVFSDGVAPFDPVVDPATETTVVSVLAPARNAGIVRFATRPAPSPEAAAEALLEIVATDPSASPVPVELLVSDASGIRIRRQLELLPGARFTALIDIGSFDAGGITARIRTPGDALPLDDSASLIEAPERRVRSDGSAPHGTALEGREHRPSAPRRVAVTVRNRTSFVGSAAGRALEAGAELELVSVRAMDDADDPAATADIDIAAFHRTAPATPPGLPTLYLNPPDAAAAGGLAPAAEGPRLGARIQRVAPDHPVLTGVNLLDLPVVVANRELDSRCTALATAAGRPAVTLCDPAPGLLPRTAVLAFELDASPIARRPDLAVLLQNTADWLTATSATTTDPGVQDERVSRLNDSALAPMPADRMAQVDRPARRPWPWRTLAALGLLLASLEAVTFFRGLTL